MELKWRKNYNTAFAFPFYASRKTPRSSSRQSFADCSWLVNHEERDRQDVCVLPNRECPSSSTVSRDRFYVTSKVHVLSEDICSLSRNSKEKLDVLGDLESRVQKLRYTNMHGSSSRPWADRQVNARTILCGLRCRLTPQSRSRKSARLCSQLSWDAASRMKERYS